VKSYAEIREDVTGELHRNPEVTKIQGAFRRAAEVDARCVRAEMPDHTAELLYGHIHSLSQAAEPGVGRVESHLLVSP
jgi:hypothetical protein